MSPGIVIGTFLSTFIASYVNSIYLAVFFTAFMLFIALSIFMTTGKQNTDQPSGSPRVFFPSIGIGSISVLVAIGGGSLTVPYLLSKNIDIKKAIGTSAAIGFPISLAGTLGYLINGYNGGLDANYSIGFIHLPSVLFICVTSVITAPYGVKASHQLPVKILKKLFAMLLIILSFTMLISLF